MDWLDLLVVQGTLKSLLQHHSPKALSLCYGPFVTSVHDYWKNQYSDNMKCRGRSALRDPICYSFLLCAVSQGFSIPYQFLENRNEQSCMQFLGLRSWERAPAWIPFSDLESESEVAQSCLTLWDPMDHSLPGSSVHGIFQARVLEWVGISFSRVSSWPRDQTCIVGRRFTVWATREVYSVMPLLLKIWNAFWPFEDRYLLGYVFAQFFYCLKLPCMKMYKHAFLQIKHPCFTWDLVPLRPSSHQLQSPGPGLQRPWH